MPGKRLYVGIKNDQVGSLRELFWSAEPPTQNSHGEKYNAVVGPFRTRSGAICLIHFGGNPHIRGVADAERIAPHYKDQLSDKPARRLIPWSCFSV